jgi:hypothetical protein
MLNDKAIYTIMNRTGKTLVIENTNLPAVFDSLFDAFAGGCCDAVKIFKDGEILIDKDLGNLVYKFGMYKKEQFAIAEANVLSFAEVLVTGGEFRKDKQNVNDELSTMFPPDRHRY